MLSLREAATALVTVAETGCFFMGGPGATSRQATHTDNDGYTTYTPRNGVRITSGMGDTVTVSCRGGNDECFAEASRRLRRV